MHLCIFCNIRSGTDTSWKQEISCRPPIFLRKQRMSPDWPGKRKVKQASNHLFFFKGHVKFDVTNISLFESPSVITPGGCIRIILHTEIFLSHVFVGCGPLPASDHEDYSMFRIGDHKLNHHVPRWHPGRGSVPYPNPDARNETGISTYTYTPAN